MVGRNKNVASFTSGGITPYFGTVDEGFLIPVYTPDGLWGSVAPSQIGIGSGVVLIITRAAAQTSRISRGISAVQTDGYTTAGDGGGGIYRRVSSQPAHEGKFRSADGTWWELVPGLINVEQFGAKGDGVTDDTAAINAAGTYAVFYSLDCIQAQPGRTFKITNSLRPRQNLIWDFKGSAINCNVGVGMWQDASEDTKVTIGTVTADITAPTNVLPLSSVAGLAVGDWVGVRLGNNPYDIVEPRYAFATQVTAIAGLNVTLDHVIPINITVTTATTQNKSLYKLTDNPINLTFRNMELTCGPSAGVEGGFFLRWGVNIRLENVNGNLNGRGDMGAGLFGLIQFCRDIYIGPSRLYANVNTRGQSSLGRMINMSNCINVEIDQPSARNIWGPLAFFESYCEQIVIRQPKIEVNTNATIASYSVISVVQESDVRIYDPSVDCMGPQITQFVGTGGTNGQYAIYGTFRWRGQLPRNIFFGRNMHGVLDYAYLTDYAIVDFGVSAWRSVYVPSVAGQSVNSYFPGPIIEAYGVVSNNTVLAGVTGFFLGWQGTNGTDRKASLQTGKSAFLIENGVGSDWGNFPALASMGKLLVNMDGTGQPGTAFVGMVARCAAVLESSAGNLGVGGAVALSDLELAKLLRSTP